VGWPAVESSGESSLKPFAPVGAIGDKKYPRGERQSF
jgi:hypothetical protein